MKYLKKIFEAISKGWSREDLRFELYSNCDGEINGLQEKLEKLILLREHLDSDLNELDFFIRTNFSELLGFSHYFFDNPGHSSNFVKCKLEVVFTTSELKREELFEAIKDFLNDCKELQSIKLDQNADIYEGKDWSSYEGWRYVTYLSTASRRT
jgi:hypothetical protein